MDSEFSAGSGFGRRVRESAAWVAAAALGFALLHVLLDLPTWRAPASVMRGWAGDNLVFAWNLWWVATNMWEMPATIVDRCPIVFFPDGFSFLFHTHTWLYGFVCGLAQFPWRAAGAEPPSIVLFYNLLGLWSTVATGLGTMAIVRESGVAQRRVAFVASLVFVFGGFRLVAMYGHLHFLGTEFLVWASWFFLRAMRADGRGAWAWGGFVAGLGFLNDQTLGIMAMTGWGIFAFCAVARPQSGADRARTAFRSLLGPAAWLATGSWQMLSLAKTFASPDYVLASDATVRYCDAVNLLWPNVWQEFTGPYFERLRGGVANVGAVGFLGFAPLAACLYGAARSFGKWRETLRTAWRSPWVWWAVLGLFLALGEMLVVRNVRVCPLPGWLLHRIPGINNLRVPDRFVLMLSLAFVVASARAFAFVLAERRGTARAAWSAVFALLLAHDMNSVEVHVSPRDAGVGFPPALEEILRADDVEARDSVLTVPFSWERQTTLFQQTLHRRPIVFGAAARVSKRLVGRRRDDYRIVRTMTHVYAGEPTISLRQGAMEAGGIRAARRQMAGLCESHGVRFVLFDKAVLRDVETADAIVPPGYRAVFDDANWRAYERVGEAPE